MSEDEAEAAVTSSTSVLEPVLTTWPIAPSTVWVRFLSGRDASFELSHGADVACLRRLVAAAEGLRDYQVRLLSSEDPQSEFCDRDSVPDGAVLLCLVVACILSEDFSDRTWCTRWLPSEEGGEAKCLLDVVREEDGTACLMVVGPAGVTPDRALHRNGLRLELSGAGVQPRRIRWRQKLCACSGTGVACGYFLVNSSEDAQVVRVHSELGSDCRIPRGRWVTIEAALAWFEDDVCEVSYTVDDGAGDVQTSRVQRTRIADARYIYLYNRSDTRWDTARNEVRYADIFVE